MKRKILTLALALIMVVSMAVPVWAEDTTVSTSGGTGQTAMTYSVEATFSVSIPAAVTINTASKTATLTVGVKENAVIAHGTSILVKLTTCDFLLSNNGDNIAYTITKDASTPVAQGDTILTHAAGTQTASSKDLSLAVTGAPKYSGEYSDQITFTVSVE